MNREFTISNLPFYVQLHESENQAIMHEATWERGGGANARTNGKSGIGIIISYQIMQCKMHVVIFDMKTNRQG